MNTTEKVSTPRTDAERVSVRCHFDQGGTYAGESVIDHEGDFVPVEIAEELERELAAMKALISLAVDCGEACGMDGAYPDAWEQMKAAVAK